jgi:hypothetical protein
VDVFGIVTYFAISTSKIYNLPIALLQLIGAYTSEAIATAIIVMLQAY